MQLKPRQIQLVLIAVLGIILIPHELVWGRPENAELIAIQVAAGGLAFGFPLAIMFRHRYGQNRILSRIRALYAQAVEWEHANKRPQAEKILVTVRNLEARWRYGASAAYRYALISYVGIVSTVGWVTMHVVQVHISNNRSAALPELKRDTIFGTVEMLVERPAAITIFVVITATFMITVVSDLLADLADQTWAEFYGDRLAAMLRAQRHISMAPQHEGVQLPNGNVSARELLGLVPGYTRHQVKAAWRRLARELHPDRWHSQGDGIRAMKEAALKRINVARDELLRGLG